MNNFLSYFKRTDPNLKLVYDDDLDKYIDGLGIDEELNKGKINCKLCGIQITRGNIAAFVPNNGKVAIICDRVSCINKIEEQVK